MSNRTVGSNETIKERDPDFVKAEIAMQRAAQKAREKAKHTGTGIVVLKDGGIVEECAEDSAG